MENHHFEWENPLFLWAIFNSKLLNYQRVLLVILVGLCRSPTDSPGISYPPGVSWLRSLGFQPFLASESWDPGRMTLSNSWQAGLRQRTKRSTGLFALFASCKPHGLRSTGPQVQGFKLWIYSAHPDVLLPSRRNSTPALRVEGEKLRMKRQQWPKWLMHMGQLRNNPLTAAFISVFTKLAVGGSVPGNALILHPQGLLQKYTLSSIIGGIL